jgi:organic hydroperoxide reductase OsmC/OhrA
MSEHKAVVRWKFSSGDFIRGRYSREHEWVFDGGVTVPASPSPSVVPAPYSNAAHVDPEEAFVASVSSCHMLTFLYLAARAKIAIESYSDDAVGLVSKNEHGHPWISKITLRPVIVYSAGAAPDAQQLQQLHHQAHEQCFIANSIKTEVVVDAAH